MSGLTPMMKQYNKIKAEYPGTILFFRMGDFYETFGDDAVVAEQQDSGQGDEHRRRDDGDDGDDAKHPFERDIGSGDGISVEEGDGRPNEGHQRPDS